jgi:RNA polymerase sigma-70 factor (ECF subfamily)
MTTGGWVAAMTAGSIGARDGELIERAASGDRDAFDRLIRPRLDRLYRMAVAITRSEADARDATQDACVLAWRELPRLRDREKFDAWLSQIVVNAARGVVRRTGRARIRELSIDADDGADGKRSYGEPSVAAETDTFADSEAIQRAFARLDGTTRALLALHYVEGTPLREIARATGSPVGTVKWRLSNARRALGKALEAERR